MVQHGRQRAKLRGCDLVCLQARDVFMAGRVKERASMVQSTTGQPFRFEITEVTRHSLGVRMRAALGRLPSSFRLDSRSGRSCIGTAQHIVPRGAPIRG